MRRKTLPPWIGALLASVVLCIGQPVHATDRVETLAARLAGDSDFRVRAQAALALGASADPKAVEPLCRALGDENATVRAAGAAALGRLRRGGQDCLKKRLGQEKVETVRKVLARSVGLVGSSGDPPRLTDSTRYYVAIGTITDSTGRESTIDSMVRTAMAGVVDTRDGYTVAPEGESLSQARKLLSKFRKAKGFFLSPTVTAPSYANGNLVVRVEIALFTYPAKALKGMIPVKLTQPGVTSPNRATEDELIRAAAERAVEKFIENIQRME